MTKLEAAGWRIRQLFPAFLSGQGTDRGSAAADGESVIIKLLESPHRAPQTPIQQALIAALKEAGRPSLDALVKRVSGELYRDELHKGAAVLDIGLFGDRLFNRDIIQELRAGDGIFWEIKAERGFQP